MLEQACRQTAAWQRDIDPALAVSVNISGRQVTIPRSPPRWRHRRALRAPGGTLALEITESAIMEEAESPVTVLGSLHAHGLALVLERRRGESNP